MTTRKRFVYRYLLIALVFCMVSVIYVGRLFYIQITGRGNKYNDGITESIVKIQAVRGEIFDRNGEVLVGNDYSYSLTINFSSISTIGASAANRTYLKLLETLDVCGMTSAHSEPYFPFQGTYPDYALSPEATNPDSPVHYRLARLLRARGLDEDSSVKDIVNEYVDAYRLLETDDRGNRIYSNYQIDRLLRLHYDMEAKQFSLANDYVFAEETNFAFMTYVREMSLTGIQFQVSADRKYYYPGYASHILGSIGPIYAEEWDYYNDQGYPMNAIVGKTGCELAFEEYLRGVDGEMRVRTDANGNVIQTELISPPIAGKDVYLTIDIRLQIAAEDGLKENVEFVQENDYEAVEGFESDAGAAVVMDPNTFEVLAIASYPTYDLSTYSLDYNDLLANTARPLVNRALRETYAPGSTFKVGVGLAGLCEGVITSSSTIKCIGYYDRFSDYHPGCSTYPHSSSNLNLTQALAVSCNCYFYELGYRLGIGTMDRYMTSLGIGQSTGIELSEATGVLAGMPGTYIDEWWPGNTVQAAIGQSDNKSTPLQLCSYLSTIVNGGTRYATHLLDRVYNFGNNTPIYSDEAATSILSSLEISAEDQRTIMKGLKQMIAESGAAKNYLIQSGVSSSFVGGKTGTAQIDRYVTNPETGELVKYELTNALFTGVYAPDDQPELVVSVVIENASHGYYASLTAARIFGTWESINNAS